MKVLDLSVSAALSLAVVVVAQTTGDGGKSNDIQLSRSLLKTKAGSTTSGKWQVTPYHHNS